MTSKQLLPVYDKPMIYYPLSTLMLAGIQDILIISTPTDTPRFEAPAGRWQPATACHLHYAVQPISRRPGAGLHPSARSSSPASRCAMILGDNIFYGNGFSKPS